MFRSVLALAWIVGVVSVVAGCGGRSQNAEETSSTLRQAIQSSPTNARAAAAGDSSNRSVYYYWPAMVADYLNRRFGANPEVTTVVLVGGYYGASYSPYPTGYFNGQAGQVIFQKDANNQFQLATGNVVDFPLISTYSLSPYFYALGILPLITSGAALCAGSPVKTVESGSLVVGLASLYPFNTVISHATYASRSVSTFQVSSIQCDANLRCVTKQTGQLPVPIDLSNFTPVCSALLNSGVAYLKKK